MQNPAASHSCRAFARVLAQELNLSSNVQRRLVKTPFCTEGSSQVLDELTAKLPGMMPAELVKTIFSVVGTKDKTLFRLIEEDLNTDGYIALSYKFSSDDFVKKVVENTSDGGSHQATLDIESRQKQSAYTERYDILLKKESLSLSERKDKEFLRLKLKTRYNQQHYRNMQDSEAALRQCDSSDSRVSTERQNNLIGLRENRTCLSYSDSRRVAHLDALALKDLDKQRLKSRLCDKKAELFNQRIKEKELEASIMNNRVIVSENERLTSETQQDTALIETVRDVIKMFNPFN
jgi:hypothetical protein